MLELRPRLGERVLTFVVALLLLDVLDSPAEQVQVITQVLYALLLSTVIQGFTYKLLRRHQIGAEGSAQLRLDRLLLLLRVVLADQSVRVATR